MSWRASAVFAIGLWAAAAADTAAAQEVDAPAAASSPTFSNLERYLPSTAPEHAFLALPSGDARVLRREHWLLDRWPLDRLPLDRLPLDRWQPRRPDAAVNVLIASNAVVGVAVVKNALVGAVDVKQ